MPPTTTRKALRQRVIKKLYSGRFPISSTSTGAGSTTTLVDSILAPASLTEDYQDAWVHITELVGSGPAVGDIARVTNVDFSGSTSELTFSPALNATETGMDYELHYHFHPSHIHDRLDEVLENLESNLLLPLTLIVDGDMESDPATNFAVGGTETVATETTIVLHGRQSLKLTAGADDDYAKSTTANYFPGSTRLLCATDCYITGGDSVKLILYDETSGANIETAESDETGWVHLEFTATTPETCEEVSLRGEAQSNGDIIYFDNLVLLPTLGTQITPPDEAEYAADFGHLFYYPRGAGIPGSSNDLAYKLHQGSLQTWSSYSVERDDTAVVPIRLSISKTPLTHPLWIETDVDFDTLTSDSSTTVAPRDLVVYLTLSDLYDDLADEKEELGLAKEGLILRGSAIRMRHRVFNDYRNFRDLRSKIIGAKR